MALALQSILAHWLHSYNPQESLSTYAELTRNPPLVSSLERIHQHFLHLPPDTHPEDRQATAHKVSSLRNSLTHLTSHLSSLTDRLAASQASLSSLQLAHDRASSAHVDELLTLRALCAVWEGRWREEKRGREDAEEKLALEQRKGKEDDGRRSLNGTRERKETEMRVLREQARPRPSRPSSRRLSASSSSSAASITPTRPHPGSRSRPGPEAVSSRSTKAKKERTSKRALLLHLSLQFEEQKREYLRALEVKEEVITRLQSDQDARQSEAQRLYSSLDILLSLGVPTASTAAAVPLPPADANEAEQLATSQSTHPRQHSRRISILSHPALTAAAAHSRSRSAVFQDLSFSKLPAEVGETRKLEEEVRGLEEQIARLDASTTSRLAEAPPDAESLAPQDRLDLLRTISDLNAQVERLQVELREVKNERRALRGVCERYRETNAGRTAQAEERAFRRIEELENERDRLSRLLSSAESSVASLTAQLSSTHTSIDALSARVRRKLEEQKEKLEAACVEIEALREEAEAWRGRCEELEGVMEEMEKARRGEGEGDV